jgi:hypothetical protein
MCPTGGVVLSAYCYNNAVPTFYTDSTNVPALTNTYPANGTFDAAGSFFCAAGVEGKCTGFDPIVTGVAICAL